MPAGPLRNRLLARLGEPTPTGCREFTGARNGKGYGSIGVSAGRSRAAHRVMWELTYGPIPAGMMVLHHCDNPPCCEPSHLYLGTNADNMADMVERGRHRSPLGERTHCKYGHEFTPENTYIQPSGARHCRACKNATWRAWYHRRKEQP